MKRLTLLLFTLISLSVIGQEVKNVTFEQIDNKIIIHYDLTGKNIYNVNCYYTIDDGQTYSELKSVTGDIGEDVSSGNDKSIIWDVFKDSDGIKGQIQFKIVAKGIYEKNGVYISGSIGLILKDGYAWSIRTGYYSKGKVGLGLSFMFLKNSTGDGHYQHLNISPILSFKLHQNKKYQLIGTIQTGLSYTDSYVPYQEKSYISYVDNFKLGLVMNWKHFNTFIDYCFIKGVDYNKFNPDFIAVNEDSDTFKNKQFLSLGIGYTF